MTGYAIQRIRNDKNVIEKFTKRCSYITIDEFQDTDGQQLELIRSFSRSGNVMAVGDDDQSIYSFRGADPSIMKKFIKLYPETKEYYMTDNYRSLPCIVDFANKIIKDNTKRFEKDLYAIKSSGEGSVKIVSTEEENDEYKKIYEYINGKLKIKNETVCVIARNNKILELLSVHLTKSGIKFNIRDRIESIYEFSPIKVLLSFLRIAYKNSTAEDMARVMNLFFDYGCVSILTGKDKEPEWENTKWKCIENYLEYDKEALRKLNEVREKITLAGKMQPISAIIFIRKCIGVDDYFRISFENNAESKRIYEEKVSEFQSVAEEFKSIGSFLKFKDEYESKNISDNNLVKNKRESRVTLTTIHSSKGLEFDNVWIMRANNGVIPSKKAEEIEEIEEERRMLYVAITRAKTNLVISSCKKIRGKDAGISEFLRNVKK